MAAPALPTGTVTFLFTDVEGSTRLWERHPDQMRSALTEHDALIEFLTVRHAGVVVRPRGEGDSRFCVFARASDAITAAASIQRALHEALWPPETPLRVRMALHTGEADLRDGDYYGSAVNRAARLRGIAHGGQTLVSQSTYDLNRGALADGATLRDLGELRLRDLALPERAYQLVIPSVPSDFPPPTTLDAVPNNLPLQLTSFVGRDRELSAIAQEMTCSRLLTLTGTGGCGKTRLALQAAAHLIDTFPDGVWFVDLSPLADPSLAASSVLTALGAAGADDTSGRPASVRLADYLRPKQALLVLDNCEHLVETCARLADSLIRQCPGVRILATSRELLSVSGETAWRVPPLSMPDPAAHLERFTAAEVAQYEAVHLFVDRARAAQPTFRLTDANAPAVAQLCHRLDGIPLALELAAARVRVLTVEQIAARLSDRFRLLTGGGRTALRRQQTLQALVDWSHDLLSEPERALFRRLAVFAGGFPLEAVEAVGAGAPVAENGVLDLLAGLVDKSLVLAEAWGAEERYRLLETMRQYAEDKLLQSGEAVATRDGHLRWCLALSAAVATDVANGEHPTFGAAARRLRSELDNVRAALTWCAASPQDAPIGLEILSHADDTGIGETWSESRRWLETFLDLVPAPTAARARCLLLLNHSLRWHHEFAGAGAAAREAREIYERLGDDGAAVEAAVREGLVAANLGDYARGAALVQPALDRALARGDWVRVEQHGRDLAVIAFSRRDFVTARRLLEQSLAVLRRHVAPEDRGSAGVPHLVRLAALDRLERNFPRARERLEEARRAVGDGTRALSFSEQLPLAFGNLAREERNFDEAHREILGALRRVHQRGGGAILLPALCMAGALEIAHGAAARGVVIVAACDRGEGPIGTIHIPDVRAEIPGFLQRAEAVLGPAAYAAAWAEGAAMTTDQAVAYALEATLELASS